MGKVIGGKFGFVLSLLGYFSVASALLSLVFLIFVASGPGPNDIRSLLGTARPVLRLHHEMLWYALNSLGIGKGLPLWGSYDDPQTLRLFYILHGTNVLLGTLSFGALSRVFGRATTFPSMVERGGEFAWWMLQTVTAGIIGSYAWHILMGPHY